MNTVKEALDKRGISYQQAVKAGIPYFTARYNYLGLRRVGPMMAILYEKALGIPRSELRPDLWPATNCEHAHEKS